MEKWTRFSEPLARFRPEEYKPGAEGIYRNPAVLVGRSHSKGNVAAVGYVKVRI